MLLTHPSALGQNSLSAPVHPAQPGPASDLGSAVVVVGANNYYLNTEYRVINLTGDFSTYGYIYYASLYASPSYVWLVVASLMAIGAIISNAAAIFMHLTAICYTRHHLYRSGGSSPHPPPPTTSATQSHSCGATGPTAVGKQLSWHGRRLGCLCAPFALLARWCKAGLRWVCCRVCRGHRVNRVISQPVIGSYPVDPTQSPQGEHRPGMPGVSIIKPLAGLDSNLEANLLAYFTLDYPLYEVLFCVASAEDPVCAIVQRLQQAHPHIESRLLITSECFGVNPKVNNLQAGYEVTQYELILISDSGVWMRPDTLTDMVVSLNADPRIGMVHQVPFMTPHDCLFGHQGTSHSECLSKPTSHQYPSKITPVSNTDCSSNPTSRAPSFTWVIQQVYFGCWHARLYMNAALFDINCTSGMSCLLRKCVLQPCGGFKPFSCYIAEDYFLTQYFRRNGWLIRISHQPAWQNSPCHSLSQFLSRITRWSQLRMTMTFVAYAIEPVTRCFPNALMGAVAFSHLLPGLIDPGVYFLCYTLVWFLLDYILLCSIYPSGLPICITKLEYLIAWCFWEIAAVPFHYSCAFNRELMWRNRRFLVHWGGYSEQLSPPCRVRKISHSPNYKEEALLTV